MCCQGENGLSVFKTLPEVYSSHRRLQSIPPETPRRLSCFHLNNIACHGLCTCPKKTLAKPEMAHRRHKQFATAPIEKLILSAPTATHGSTVADFQASTGQPFIAEIFPGRPYAGNRLAHQDPVDGVVTASNCGGSDREMPRTFHILPSFARVTRPFRISSR